MRSKYLLLRVLAGMVDVIVVYVPVVVLAILILHANFRVADILGQLGFVVYNIIMIASYQGQTLGKKIGREYVLINDELPNGKMLIAGIREVTKVIYFLPFVGWVFGVISLVLGALTGRMIHDYFGNSTVVLEKDLVRLEK
ncbi:RDD family protein [Lactiplantibacillus pentosus]|uniref:RDD family protein n=1 Tax=Lactiplantibacillus pentosus TaxID=1589 RepID=A0AAW8VSV0_LACPE|nr:RDD family protein [Lactiplantibacillus pentosus]MBU7473639.1 RDD family protein [Lactiplantibacillus pentosus]MBU7528477.1 RDD family protein [Lactiplantibacillus pentosus]MDT6989743.1 RDD family protein [Lactiplantibacillus pentosus]